MTQQNIDFGTGAENDGEFIATAFQKIQANFDELYSSVDGNAADLAAHLYDATDAHDASAVSVTPSGSITSTDVQAALSEIDGDVSAHLSDATDAHDASAISFIPAGSIAATNAQAAIEEVGAVLDALRDRLAADRIYYVRQSGGSDANDGLSFGNAFATIQKAVDVAYALDTVGYNISIVCYGSFTAGAVVKGRLFGGGSLSILGSGFTYPYADGITKTGGHCIHVTEGAFVTARGLNLSTVTSGNCLTVDLGSYLIYGAVDFGSSAGMHIDAGSQCNAYAAFDYHISGGAVGHFHTGAPCNLFTNAITITLHGTPAFSAYFSGTAGGYQELQNVTFSGSATGKRYLAHKQGVISVGTTSETFLPGDVAGTTESGGKYAGDVTYKDLIGDLGTYTPTHTAVANIAASTAYVCRWKRVGGFVQVTGRLDVTPTAASTTDTRLGISLPIASAFTDITIDCAGMGCSPFGVIGSIAADVTNDRAEFRFPSPNTTNNVVYFTFEYTVK